MENFPLVSVIIPCYNHEKYVTDTLNSVLEDTYPNKEICIIDDGSKDGSVSVIEDWIRLHGEEVCVKFRTRANKGVCPTLNELIRMAEGKYLVPCASDDMLLKDTLGIRVNLMKYHAGKKILASDAQVIDENNNLICPSSLQYHKSCIEFYSDPRKMLKTLLFGPWGYIGPVLMIDKELYQVIGLYDEHLAFEDHDFFLRVISQDLIFFSDIICSKYRVNSQSLSHNPTNQYKGTRAILKSYVKALKYYDGVGKYFLIKAIAYKYYVLTKMKIRKICTF